MQEFVGMWARAHGQRPTVHALHRPEEVIGWCWGCDAHRTRAEALQLIRYECCVHACAACGATLDDSEAWMRGEGAAIREGE
jgi:hypothetical protein